MTRLHPHRPAHPRLAVAVVVSGLALAGCSSPGTQASSRAASAPVASRGPLQAGGTVKCYPTEASAAYTPTGTLVADSGFRPETDGLGFENYGVHVCDSDARPLAQPAANLRPAEMRRLFGDVVCGSEVSDTCALTPPAAAWMKETNGIMAGGHCYGFSVTALLIRAQQVGLEELGGGGSAAELPAGPALQHQIAYAFSHQLLASVRGASIKGTPTQILAKLREVLAPDAAESYTIAIFKRSGDGGHAVTPYAIEDNGDGTFHVLIYDNNYPTLTRAMVIDTQADTWAYDASTNPNEPQAHYEGDADTHSLELYPVTPGTAVQPAPFGGTAGDDGATGSSGRSSGSAGRSAGSAGRSAAALRDATPLEQVSLRSADRGEHPHLLVTAPDGTRTGFVGGKLVNEIPHAQVARDLSADDWMDAAEPTYFVPSGAAYKVTVDATGLAAPDVVGVEVIGHGFAIGVKDIALQGGDQDTLSFEPGAARLTYTTSRAESPTIEVGVDDDKADYAFTAAGVDVPGGGSMTLALPVEGGNLTLSSSGAGTYALRMERTDKAGMLAFEHDRIDLAAGDTATLQFGAWDADGQSIPLVVDHGGATQTTQLTDEPSTQAGIIGTSGGRGG